MLKVTNINVYDLKESVIASGNAMRTKMAEYAEEEFLKGLTRMKKLVQASRNGEVKCHDNALVGIRVSFDLVYSNLITPEMQRYHWFDIVTSSSKMHRIMHMNADEACNKYVDRVVVDNLERNIQLFNKLSEEKVGKYSFLLRDGNAMVATNRDEVLAIQRYITLYSCPMGLELFERVSTNYKQLQTIYHQRKHHRLKEWHNFCSFIEKLPYFQELIIGQDYDENFEFITDIDE